MTRMTLTFPQASGAAWARYRRGTPGQLGRLRGLAQNAAQAAGDAAGELGRDAATVAVTSGKGWRLELSGDVAPSMLLMLGIAILLSLVALAVVAALSWGFAWELEASSSKSDAITSATAIPPIAICAPKIDAATPTKNVANVATLRCIM